MLVKTISVSVGLVVVFDLAAASHLFAQQPSVQQPSGRPATRSAQRQASAPLPGAISVADATELTNGWALLAEGRPAQAAVRAERVLANQPRNGAAVSLAIEAEIAQAGSIAALDQYERWLGRRVLEEPGTLRRIAQTLLWEEARRTTEPVVRREALQALAEDGDASAARELGRQAEGRDAGSSATGDAANADTLIGNLNRHIDDVRTIESLGAIGSSRAIAPLIDQLKDDRIEVRGAAAEALGRIGDRDVIPHVKPLLSDRNIYVRIKAAGALLALDDDSGLAMLQEMLLDPAADTRLAAAEILASRPDTAWLAAVRQLTEESDSAIRAAAARLLAPHEPEVARTVLQSLTSDENAAVRELAAQGLSEVMPNDIPTLRRTLRDPTPLPRVRAARRVLTMTR